MADPAALAEWQASMARDERLARQRDASRAALESLTGSVHGGGGAPSSVALTSSDPLETLAAAGRARNTVSMPPGTPSLDDSLPAPPRATVNVGGDQGPAALAAATQEQPLEIPTGPTPVEAGLQAVGAHDLAQQMFPGRTVGTGAPGVKTTQKEKTIIAPDNPEAQQQYAETQKAQEETYDEEQEAALRQGVQTADFMEQMAGVRDDTAQAFSELRDEYGEKFNKIDESVAKIMDERAALSEKTANSPSIKRYWAQKSTGEKILSAFAVLLSAVGQWRMGQGGVQTENMALNTIKQSIDQDLQLQQQEIDNARGDVANLDTALAHLQKERSSLGDLRGAAQDSLMNKAQLMIQGFADRVGSAEAQATADRLVAGLERQKLESRKADIIEREGVEKRGVSTQERVGRRYVADPRRRIMEKAAAERAKQQAEVGTYAQKQAIAAQYRPSPQSKATEDRRYMESLGLQQVRQGPPPSRAVLDKTADKVGAAAGALKALQRLRDVAEQTGFFSRVGGKLAEGVGLESLGPENYRRLVSAARAANLSVRKAMFQGSGTVSDQEQESIDRMQGMVDAITAGVATKTSLAPVDEVETVMVNNRDSWLEAKNLSLGGGAPPGSSVRGRVKE